MQLASPADPAHSSAARLLGGCPMPLILTEVRDHVGTIVMHNPEKRNALSEALIEDVCNALNQFKEDKLRAAVLRAPKGCKVWSAGHDINDLPNRGRDPLGWGDSLRVMVRAIQQFPAPVIALIEGGVWGGACEVAMACDILVATPEATFAITPAKLGIPYSLTGLLTLMNCVPLPVAKEMLFTAQPIPTSQALNLGIINYVKPADEIEAFVYGLAAKIVVNAPLSIAVMKEELRLLASAHALPPELFERLQGLRRIVYDSADYEEGLRSFMEKRKPQFRGA
jgi:methylmalonyl-CoA decarboxylase